MAKKSVKKAVKRTTKTAAKSSKPAAKDTKRSVAAARKWTSNDVRSLKAHSKAKTPVAKISKEMKRTVGALRQKGMVLGIGLGANR